MGIESITRNKLISIYNQYGLATAIQVGFKSLGCLGDAAKGLTEKQIIFVKTNMNGEISETVLELILTEFMRLHPKETENWHLSKGLILKNPERPRSRFMTELDLTLFTPKCVYVFECKSYSGDKRLVDKGTILRLNGNSCDVFRQNAIHLQTLHANIGRFSDYPIYRMALFDFSRGDVEDERDDKNKDMLPYTTIDNVLKQLVLDGNNVWKIKPLLQVVRILEDASVRLRSEHLKYVKELHSNE